MISIVAQPFVFLTFMSVIVANPISRSNVPWSQPCHPSTHLESELRDSLSITTSEAFDIAATLKDRIFTNRLDGSWNHAQALEIHSIPPFPRPDAVLSWESGQTEEVLMSNYRHLSYLLAFLEVTKEDCMIHKQTDDVLEHVRNLENKVYEVLCHIQNLLFSRGVTVDNHVTRDEIPVQVREMTSRAYINRRDYVIVKDAFHLLRAIRDTHLRMNA